MSKLDERKKGFEAKYEQDQEVEFKIRALRNKLVGEWAAKLVNPENESEYIKEVRLSDLEKPGDEDIIEKLINDFKLKNIDIEKKEIQNKLDECQRLAHIEFKNKI